MDPLTLEATRDVGTVTFGRILGFLDYFTQLLSSPETGAIKWTTFGQDIEVTTITTYLLAVLPQLLLFVGIVIAIKVALKAFKKFSR